MSQKYRTKTEKVYFNLQQEIRTGVIRPGSRLIISQLAKRFNVSDIPVREALQSLAREGYVLLNPHSGAVVSSLSEDDIRQIFELRINLEGLASRLAVDHLSNSHLQTLEQMIEESKQYLQSGDIQAYGKSNRAFHEYIYQHSNNSRLSSIITDLWDLSTRYPIFFNNPDDLKVSIEEHTEILQALKNRDALLVEVLVKEHKTRVYQHLIQLVRDTHQEVEHS